MNWVITTLNTGSCCRQGFSGLLSMDLIGLEKRAGLAKMRFVNVFQKCYTIMSEKCVSSCINQYCCTSSIRVGCPHSTAESHARMFERSFLNHR